MWSNTQNFLITSSGDHPAALLQRLLPSSSNLPSFPTQTYLEALTQHASTNSVLELGASLAHLRDQIAISNAQLQQEAQKQNMPSTTNTNALTLTSLDSQASITVPKSTVGGESHFVNGAKRMKLSPSSITLINETNASSNNAIGSSSKGNELLRVIIFC